MIFKKIIENIMEFFVGFVALIGSIFSLVFLWIMFTIMGCLPIAMGTFIVIAISKIFN